MIDKEKWKTSTDCAKYDFIKATLNVTFMDCLSKDDLIMMCKFMLDMSSEERQKGKWIIGETYDCHSDIIKTYTCPFCGVKEYSKYPFCHCGADMRGEENE